MPPNDLHFWLVRFYVGPDSEMPETVCTDCD
jgi:hypothetical protein